MNESATAVPCLLIELMMSACRVVASVTARVYSLKSLLSPIWNWLMIFCMASSLAADSDCDWLSAIETPETLPLKLALLRCTELSRSRPAILPTTKATVSPVDFLSFNSAMIAVFARVFSAFANAMFDWVSRAYSAIGVFRRANLSCSPVRPIPHDIHVASCLAIRIVSDFSAIA